jgi:hypothetical protein
MHAGLTAEAVAAIRDADAVGLADIVWLERCPTIAALRTQPDLQRIQRNVAARAARIRSALGSRVGPPRPDPPTSPPRQDDVRGTKKSL